VQCSILEFVVQMFAHVLQELVAATTIGHFEMCGERGLRRAHWPNMQVSLQGRFAKS
jgi:hypothetical protein